MADDADPPKEDKVAAAWRQVNHIIQEVIHTEKAYFKSLRNMVEEWYEPIRARVGLEEEVLTAPQLNTIFGNITVIYALHRDLLSDLEAQGTEPGDIGKVFALFSPYLKMYTAYLNNNSAGIAMWAQVQRQRNHSVLHQFCAARKGEPLDSLMIKPVQRIPRYKMLLEELLKHMPDNKETQTKRANLEMALKAVSESAMHCNEHIAKAVKSAEAHALQERFQGKVPVNLDRRLLLEERMYKKNRRGALQERVFVLFTDCLLYCKSAVSLAEHKTHLFPLEAKDVDSTAYPHHHVDGFHPFEVRASSKSYIVYTKTSEQKNKWIQQINESVAAYTDERAMKFRRAAQLTVGDPVALEVVECHEDEWKDSDTCQLCQKRFRRILRPKHHCRRCGLCVCHPCSSFTHVIGKAEKRICTRCNQDLIITNQKQAYSAPVWTADTSECVLCNVAFERFKNTRHHCRNCGDCVCNNCSDYRFHLPNDAVGRDSRVCKNCFHSLKEGRRPSTIQHTSGDESPASQQHRQPQPPPRPVSTASVDGGRTAAEQDSESESERPQSGQVDTSPNTTERVNWRQSVMGPLDTSSILNAAKGLKKRRKPPPKKQPPVNSARPASVALRSRKVAAPKASWIRARAEEEARWRAGFDSGADSDASDSPPPTPARRRTSVDTGPGRGEATPQSATETSDADVHDAEAAGRTHSRKASASSIEEVAEAPDKRTDRPNSRSFTLKRYGVVPITGDLDSNTQAALQKYLIAHWSTAAFRKKKLRTNVDFKKGELKLGTRKALLTLLRNSPHCKGIDIQPETSDDKTLAFALQAFLNAEWARAGFRKEKLSNKGKLSKGTIKALQCFLGSFDQNPEPVPTAIVSGSSAGSRRSLSRSRSLSRQSPSRTSSASSAASSTVVRASVSSEAPTSADSKASASRKSVGLRPTQRGRHAPASKPPRPGSTSSSASGSSRPTSSRAKPPIPIRPKSVGLSRPNSVRLQERLATAAGEGGAGTRLSMSSRHSTDSLPPLPPEAYHATPQTVEEIESPPIVPPRPKSLPIPSDDDEDGVHGAAMKRDAKSSPAAGRVIPRGGLSGEFAAIIIAGAPSGNAGSGDDGDASDDDGPLPVAPPRRASNAAQSPSTSSDTGAFSASPSLSGEFASFIATPHEVQAANEAAAAAAAAAANPKRTSKPPPPARPTQRSSPAATVAAVAARTFRPKKVTVAGPQLHASSPHDQATADSDAKPRPVKKDPLNPFARFRQHKAGVEARKVVKGNTQTTSSAVSASSSPATVEKAASDSSGDVGETPSTSLSASVTAAAAASAASRKKPLPVKPARSPNANDSVVRPPVGRRELSKEEEIIEIASRAHKSLRSTPAASPSTANIDDDDDEADEDDDDDDDDDDAAPPPAPPRRKTVTGPPPVKPKRPAQPPTKKAAPPSKKAPPVPGVNRRSKPSLH